MQTLRQYISNIRGNNKMLSSDILISDRLLASELRNAANTIVTQQTDKRKLWSSPNVFTPIQCLEMEKVPITECCDYSGERQVARSVKKLPKIGEGTWGLAIQMVTGLDNLKKFKQTTPTRFANLLKLKLTTNDVYFWIQNDRLYISNPDTEAVNLFAYFTEDVPNDLLYPGADCQCATPPPISDLCTNPLDKPFWFPANRLIDIENIVMDRLNKSFLRLKEDPTSNNKED